MHIAIGSDHRGYALKKAIGELLTDEGHSYEDFGCHSPAPVDYPDFAKVVAQGVAQGRFDHGILVCSTGIGMSIAANKVPGAYAALCHDLLSARRSRQHNNANVLCLGASIVGEELAREIVKTHLSAEFEEARHTQRLEKVKALERA